MAVVVDEYGRVAGIVTVEDIVEENRGRSTTRPTPPGRDPPSGQRRLVRPRKRRDQRSIDYGVKLPVDTDAYNSVGGFVFAQLGRLPKRGDTVTADGYSIRVESVRDNRIEAVRIRERRAVSRTASSSRSALAPVGSAGAGSPSQRPDAIRVLRSRASTPRRG